MKYKPAKGHGQSKCRRCDLLGKYSWTWTSFLYEIEGKIGYYCWECVKELEKQEKEKTNH